MVKAVKEIDEIESDNDKITDILNRELCSLNLGICKCDSVHIKVSNLTTNGTNIKITTSWPSMLLTTKTTSSGSKRKHFASIFTHSLNIASMCFIFN
mmetsp:Transcript_63608/g.74508  ORF Transcript_63608/g.74508 Transcript_63608/m.74508 type:complete len:97 (-) Transcript_63608:110-400(-)